MTATRFRKRPIEVETVQWTGLNAADLVDFTSGRFLPINPAGLTGVEGITAREYDELHSTWVGVRTGHQVIRETVGEFYPTHEAVLAETFKRVEEAGQ